MPEMYPKASPGECPSSSAYTDVIAGNCSHSVRPCSVTPDLCPCSNTPTRTPLLSAVSTRSAIFPTMAPSQRASRRAEAFSSHMACRRSATSEHFLAVIYSGVTTPRSRVKVSDPPRYPMLLSRETARHVISVKAPVKRSNTRSGKDSPLSRRRDMAFRCILSEMAPRSSVRLNFGLILLRRASKAWDDR